MPETVAYSPTPSEAPSDCTKKVNMAIGFSPAASASESCRKASSSSATPSSKRSSRDTDKCFFAVEPISSSWPRKAANGLKIFARASIDIRGCFIKKFQSSCGYGKLMMSS